MVKKIQGNIFKIEYTSRPQAFVNPVNTLGVMGKGLAKEIKERDIEAFNDYKSICDNKELDFKGGDVIITNTVIRPYSFIFHVATKEDWRMPSKISYIKKGLNTIKKCMIDNNIQSCVLPPIGCGLGGLNKDAVYQLIEEVFAESDLIIYAINF